MNVLIIATVALTGPTTNCVEPALATPTTVCADRVAPAVFDGPASALMLGSGDALGYELFAVEVMARNETKYWNVASAD